MGKGLPTRAWVANSTGAGTPTDPPQPHESYIPETSRRTFRDLLVECLSSPVIVSAYGVTLGRSIMYGSCKFQELLETYKLPFSLQEGLLKIGNSCTKNVEEFAASQRIPKMLQEEFNGPSGGSLECQSAKKNEDIKRPSSEGTRTLRKWARGHSCGCGFFKKKKCSYVPVF